jgi:hypothetical protein
MAADLSIVTVTFGDKMAATRVGTGLEAVQRSGGDPPMEVIVVAVGPEGKAAADELVEHTAGTTLTPEIVEVDRGTSYAPAVNAGVAKTSGDVVVAARPEVTFHQRFLRRVRIEMPERWDLLAPVVRVGEAKPPIGITKRGKTHRLVDIDNLPRQPEQVRGGHGACVIIRRPALERRVAATGGLFEDAYEAGGDIDLYWWAERAGLVVRFVPNLYVGNAVGQEVIETAQERRRSMANYRVTVWKHADRRDITGWLLGEAAFLSEDVTTGGLSGLVRYAGSWKDSVQTARSIKRKRGRLRDRNPSSA